jgi:hypothetical protein
MQIDFKKPKKIYANQELHHRLSGQVGCHILASGRDRCFLDLAGLCEQDGCWYKHAPIL